MPDFALDATDRKLLTHLAHDSALPLKQLAALCHMSEATCSRRIARLEKSGAITGYAARVNPKALGLPVHIFALLELVTDHVAAKQQLLATLRGAEGVYALHCVTGQPDYLLMLRLESMEAYQRFTAEHFEHEPLIRKYTSLFSLKEY
jgi:Lrp/AsnC family leucine-responsive transcriptional regulator